MIQPLRTTHRWVFSAFAVLLPALVALGVTKRHEYVQPGLIRVELLSSVPVISQRGLFWMSTSEDSIELSATSDASQPELLVYFSRENTANVLPATARLLGQYRTGGRFELTQLSGTVLLYSPTQNIVVDSVHLGRSR